MKRTTEENDENLWDEPRLHENDPVLNSPGKLTRFIHFFADISAAMVVYYMLLFASYYFFSQTSRVPLWLESSHLRSIAPVLLYFLFVWFMESFAGGQTFGKLITRHKVVQSNDQPAGAGKIFLRTLLRFIPFEPFSIFFSSKKLMWHDKLSGTKVIPLAVVESSGEHDIIFDEGA